MSIPFLEWDHVYDEKTWILYAWLIKKTRNKLLSRFLTYKLSRRLVLNDKKYNYNPQEWMYKWLNTPSMQLMNPLLGMESVSNTMSLGLFLLIWYDKFPIKIDNMPYRLEQSCEYIPISNYTQYNNLIEVRPTQYGDYLIGILIDDSEISKITKITLTTRGMTFTYESIDIQILETIEPILDFDRNIRPRFVKVKKLFVVKELGGIFPYGAMYPSDLLISIHTNSIINPNAIRVAWIFVETEYHHILNAKLFTVGSEYGEYIANCNNIYKRPGKNTPPNEDADILLANIIRYNATIKKPVCSKINNPLMRSMINRNKRQKQKNRKNAGWQVVGKNGKPVKRKDN